MRKQLLVINKTFDKKENIISNVCLEHALSMKKYTSFEQMVFSLIKRHH